MYAPPPAVFFCPLLKKSKGRQYLKIRDFTQLFVADVTMKNIMQKFVLPPLRGLLFLVGKIA